MSTSPAQRLITFSRRPAVRRTAIGLIGLLLFFTLFGFFALPAIIQSQGEKLIAEKLLRPTTIGEVKVNPYTLEVTLRDVRLTEPQGGNTFAAFDSLYANLSWRSIIRLAPVVQEVRLSKPYLRVVRNDAHRYNFDDIVEHLSSQPPSQERARYSVNNIQLEGGRIEFEDGPVKETHTVTDLKLGVPFISSLPRDVEVFIEPLLSAKVNGTPLLLKGKARPFAEAKDAVVELNLDGLDITRFVDYLPFRPRFKVPAGRLDTRLMVTFREPKDQDPALVLTGTAALKSVRVTELDGKPMLNVPELAVTLGETDVFSGHFQVASVAVNGLQADVHRGRDQQLNLMRLMPPAADDTKAAAKADGDGRSTQVALSELHIRGATVRYTDDQPVRSMNAGVEKFDLALRKLMLDTGKRTVSVGEIASNSGDFRVRHDRSDAQANNVKAPVNGAEEAPTTAKDGTQDKKDGSSYMLSIGRVAIDNWSARLEDHSRAQPAVTTVGPLSLALHNVSTASATPARMELKAMVNKTGRLALNGNVSIAPLQTDLAMDLQGVDMLPLQPYVTDMINLQLTRANLSGKGKLQLAVGSDGALKGGYKGDMSLENLATLDKVSSNELLRWKSLSLSGMNMQLQPFALAVDQVALNEFFARVIIDANGRLNVQDIVRKDSGERRSLTETEEDGARVPRGTHVKTATLPASDKQQGKVPPISIRKLVLKGGRVRFTDNFIRPNYTATLNDFGGVVSGLSSEASSSAVVDLRGEVNRAPLSVAGRINPLSGNLSLDIKARVQGMELASLSAYSVRYVGYGIEKGKLSFEVAYRVENRKLTAQNRLVLDQLTFGKKSDNPNATKLPVQFALALLRDRNGVVDLNVPVEGSLDDPRFSLGGIIFKAIGNAIAKAVTEPFALLGRMFGGGGNAELSTIAFDPGRATIQQGAETKLQSLAKALAERPALKLDITGRVNAEVDREGLKRAFIDRKVRALKVKDLQARGQPAEFGTVVVSPDEYPALLTRVYRDEKFDKPRNAIGLQKSLPVAEMEKLMIANAEIKEEDLTALGNRRGQAAKDWLVKFGQVSGDRIFLSAAKTEPDEAKGNGAAGVDFALR